MGRRFILYSVFKPYVCINTPASSLGSRRDNHAPKHAMSCEHALAC